MTFQPNWCVPPGLSFAEYAEYYGWSDERCAEYLMITVEKLHQFYRGELPVDAILAQRLEDTTSIPKPFWENGQRNFDRLRSQGATVVL